MSRFLRFCAVGTVGFVIDAGVLQALVAGLGANPYVARVAWYRPGFHPWDHDNRADLAAWQAEFAGPTAA